MCKNKKKGCLCGGKCSSFPKDIKLYDKEYSLSQIYQSISTTFSFVTKDGLQVNPSFVCRDYAHDCIRTNHTGIASSIWGFKYDIEDTNELPIDLEQCRMLISDTTSQEIADGVHLLWHYEDMAGVERTVVKEYRLDDKKYWYFISPKFWLTSSFHISLYTMLIRLGNKSFKFSNNDELQAVYQEAFDDPNWDDDNDIKYLKSVSKIIDKFITHSFDKNLFIEYSNLDIGIFYNKGGIYSLATGVSYDEELNKVFKMT